MPTGQRGAAEVHRGQDAKPALENAESADWSRRGCHPYLAPRPRWSCGNIKDFIRIGAVLDGGNAEPRVRNRTLPLVGANASRLGEPGQQSVGSCRDGLEMRAGQSSLIRDGNDCGFAILNDAKLQWPCVCTFDGRHESLRCKGLAIYRIDPRTNTDAGAKRGPFPGHRFDNSRASNFHANGIGEIDRSIFNFTLPEYFTRPIGEDEPVTGTSQTVEQVRPGRD